MLKYFSGVNYIYFKLIFLLTKQIIYKNKNKKNENKNNF